MRGIAVAAGAFAAVALTWVAVSGQAARERPSLGSGIADVRGTVAVSRLPELKISELPPVALAPYEFVRTRGVYHVVWPDGQNEDVTAIEMGPAGWVRVSSRRWINLGSARSIEER